MSAEHRAYAQSRFSGWTPALPPASLLLLTSLACPRFPSGPGTMFVLLPGPSTESGELLVLSK